MAKKLIYEVGVGVRLIPVSSLEPGFRKGDLQVLDSDSKLYFDNGSAHLAVVTETGSATLTGKTYSAVNGSAASPSFTFDNSSTTGFYRVSADVIGISTAGTERARFDSTGSLRLGTTGNLVFNNERLSVNYSGPDITDNAFSAGAGIIQNSDTAVTASVRQYGSFARFRRTTTVNLTDTNTHYASSGIDVVFTTSGSTTYTNSSNEGINGYLVNSPLQTGAGSLAITNFSGIQVLSSSLATGTNKYGVRVGVQSGATNNYGFGYGSSLPSGSWTLASTSTNPSYLAGDLRIGSTGQIIATNERLTARYTDTVGVGITGAAAVSAELLSNGNTAVTTASGYSSVIGFLTRTTTVSVTDTSDTMAAIRTGIVFNPSSSTTYSHSGTTGISGIRVGGPGTGGAGSLAITNYNGILIANSSLNTGTNKFGIRILDQTGATNNFAIETNAGTVSFGDVVRGINGTATSPTYGFNNETNSGLYRIGTGNLGLTIQGTLRYDLTSTALAYYGPTSAIDTTPGNGSGTLALAKETTTGEGAIISYGSSGSHFLGFYTNSSGGASTQKMRIESDGDVRINGGQLQLEDPGAGTNIIGINAPSGLGASYNLTLPVDDGTPNQFLITDGSGNLSWTSTVAGSGLFSYSGSYVAPNSLAGAATLTSGADSRRISYVIGSGGPVTLSTTTPVSAGTTSGQELIIMGTSDINTVTIPMSGNVLLKAACVLGQYDCVTLAWDGTSSIWIEIGRNF